MTPRLAPAAIMVGFVLAAAILQILATIKLGLAPVDALERVAHTSELPYLLASLAVGMGGFACWLMRRHVVRATVVSAIVLAALVGGLWNRVSWLGLAYHGEFVLHHFAALLSAAASLHIFGSWIARSQFGRARWLPIVLGVLGVVGLLLVHLHELPTWRGAWFQGTMVIATGSLLGALALAPLVLWKHAHPRPLRSVTLVLLAVLGIRVGLAGWAGLRGVPVPDDSRTFLIAAIVGGAAFVFVRFRPSNPPGVRGLVVLLAAIATGLLYMMYQRSFGLLEDGIGGLAQSLLAFPLPYPEYVDRWRVLVVAGAIFAMFVSVYSGLMAYEDRIRGTALALMLLTGLGLSNAQLVLMCAAAHLLWLETLLQEAPSAEPPAAVLVPVSEVLRDLSAALELPSPVALENAKDHVVSVRGEFEGIPLDIRARQTRRQTWSIRIKIGLAGRGAPEVELRPDAGTTGARPAHALRRTHRVQGSMRALEGRGDEALDALIAFPQSHAKLWPAGSEIELGSDLSHLDSERLGNLVRAFVRQP